jgi:hypothetical protein
LGHTEGDYADHHYPHESPSQERLHRKSFLVVMGGALHANYQTPGTLMAAMVTSTFGGGGVQPVV